MTSDDLDLDPPASDSYPEDCARGLRKYLFVMAVIVVGTLSGTFWYRSLGPDGGSLNLPMGGLAAAHGGAAVNNVAGGAGFGGNGGGGNGLTGAGFAASPRPVALTAAAGGVYPDFAAVVGSLRGSVVSVGRSRPEGRFGFNRAAMAGGEAAAGGPAAAAPGGDGALQFAVPAAGAVLESIGTGFVVRNDGYILTNYHVVRGNDSMVVTVFDEAGAVRYPATIVKLDASVDLALLKIEPRAPLAVAPLGDSDLTQVADEVIAIGSPFGLDLTVSRGIISAKRKSLVIEGTVHKDLLQTDAAINQGNSGGPLVNRSGEVVGVNTAIYTPTGAFAGVGFAVPSNQAKLFLADELALQAGGAAGGAWSLPVAAPPGTTAMGTAGPPIMAGAANPHRDERATMDCGTCHQLLPRPGARAPVRGLTAAAPVMAAPPIMAGTPAPHRDGREAMDCGICHKFLPAGGVGATARGVPAAAPAMAAPAIVAGTPAPHRDGREAMDCGICHKFLPAGGVGAAARGVPAAAPAMAPPPIVAGTPAPHRDGRETMDCGICHKFLPAGGATAAPVAQPGGGGLRFARPPATLALNVAVPAQTGTAAGGFTILGASALPVTAAIAAQTGMTEGKGVFVAAVVPGSPAAEAGLEAGMVIEKVDGRRLRTPRELFSAVEAAKTGDRLRLLVTGAKGRQELRLTVSVLPAAAMAPGGAPGGTPGGAPAGAAGMAAPGAAVAPATVPTEFNWRGMEIETFAAVLPPGAGGGVQLKGAVIAEVIPGSPAQRAGLQANDIILEVDGRPAGSAAQMNQAVQAVTGKRELVMRMARNNREFFAVLP